MSLEVPGVSLASPQGGSLRSCSFIPIIYSYSLMLLHCLLFLFCGYNIFSCPEEYDLTLLFCFQVSFSVL